MSGNVKVLLAILALGALVSLFSFISMFRQPPVASLAAPSNQHADIFGLASQYNKDSDHDGLSDQEELYWETDANTADTDGDGYTDGEEVLSGHDPAKKGPNDWLDTSRNLTQRTANLITGGLIAGDLQPGSASYDATTQKIADTVAAQYKENITVTVDKVKLTANNTPDTISGYELTMALMVKSAFAPTLEDAGKFLESVQDVPITDSSVLTNDAKRLTAFITAAHTLARNAGERAAKIAAIAVPLSYLSQHQEAIRILRLIQRQYELAATIKDDPLQGMLAMQMIQRLNIETLPKYVANFFVTVSQQKS